MKRKALLLTILFLLLSSSVGTTHNPEELVKNKKEPGISEKLGIVLENQKELKETLAVIKENQKNLKAELQRVEKELKTELQKIKVRIH